MLHLNMVAGFRRLATGHFSDVTGFNRFAFLRQSRQLESTASTTAVFFAV
jgi:hypothetical protein